MSIMNLVRSYGRSKKSSDQPVKGNTTTTTTVKVQSPNDVQSLSLAPDKVHCVISVTGSSGMIEEIQRYDNAIILETVVIESKDFDNGEYGVEKCIFRAKHFNLSRMLSLLPTEITILHGRIGKYPTETTRWIIPPKDGLTHPPFVVTRVSNQVQPTQSPTISKPVQPAIQPVQVESVKPVDRVCPQCKKDIRETSKFCGFCGCKLTQDTIAPVQVEKPTVPAKKPAKRNYVANAIDSSLHRPMMCLLCRRDFDRLDGLAHCSECANRRKAGEKPGEILAGWIEYHHSQSKQAETVKPAIVAPVQVESVKPVAPAIQPAKVERVQSTASKKPVESKPVAPVQSVKTQISDLLSSILKG